MPRLYVVSTPIGNLEDVTLRALRILGEVSLIAAEDTRTTRKLLTRHGIRNRLVSYHQYSGEGRIKDLLAVLQTRDVALVSEAGTPGISDPGFPLIRAAAQQGIEVVPIPGASAVIAALAISGLPTDQFVYLGFLPRRAGERRRVLATLQAETRTAVVLEAPHRLHKTLQDLAELAGERPITICRELTKLHEEVYRGNAMGALAHFSIPRGEFTVVIGGCALAAETYWGTVSATPATPNPEASLRRKRRS